MVTGAWHDTLSQAMVQGTLSTTQLLYDAQWQRGLGSSLVFGIAQLLDQHYRGILILLGHQVGLTQGDLQKLVGAFNPKGCACAFYHGAPGVPALFRAETFHHLTKLFGPRGAKSL
ncbi:nucleotidyltransferase family protein [Magnetococcus sp. PR-3]|uniref:nucleotidyltransferase family protein n=1 Tax=Magnetococcus sp. PR-3 TaxID=3120355 RepID=UPI002FCE5B92